MDREAIVVAAGSIAILALLIALGWYIQPPTQKLLETVPADAQFASVVNVSEYRALARSLGGDQTLLEELSKADYVLSFATESYAASLALGKNVSDIVEGMGKLENEGAYKGYQYGTINGLYTVAEKNGVVIIVMGEENIQKIIDVMEEGPRRRFIDKPYVREALDAVGGSLMVIVTDLSAMAGKTAIAAVGVERAGDKVRARSAVCGENPESFLGLFQGMNVQQRGNCIVSEKEMNTSELAEAMGIQPLP